MATFYRFNQTETWDALAEEENSFQLEAFRTCDFSTAMDGEIAKVFQRTPLQVRHLPLIERYTRDKAKGYIRRPGRVFEGLNTIQAETLADVYRRSRIDAALLQADQKSHAQNSTILVVLPDRTNPLRVRLLSFIPAEVEIELAPAMIAGELREVSSLACRVPIKRTSQGVIQFGKMVLTPSEAYIEGHGKRQPLLAADGSNPLGYVPAVGIRHTEPRRGRWLPPLPLDLLSIQIGLTLGVSHIEAINRLNAAPRQVVVGPGAKGALKRSIYGGPDAILALDAEELKFQAHDLKPATEKYWQAIETTIRLLATYKQTSAEGLWHGTGLTGDAKEIEQFGLLEDLHRRERVWEDAEEELGEVVADVVSVLNPGTLQIPRPRTSVRFHYVEPKRNDLQAAQATALRQFLGLDSALEEVARVETRGDKMAAAEVVAERLEAMKATISSWGGRTPPGLDSIASQVLRGQAGGPGE